MLRHLLLALALAAGLSSAAQADGVQVVPSCGALSSTPGLDGRLTVDASGRQCGGGGVSAFSVARTTGIGTTGVQVSAADPANRRTVANTGSVACEITSGATAYGTGYPLPVGGAFTFDNAGRTTAALFVACSASGGSVAVMSY